MRTFRDNSSTQIDTRFVYVKHLNIFQERLYNTATRLGAQELHREPEACSYFDSHTERAQQVAT